MVIILNNFFSDSNSKHLTNRRNGKNISLQSQRIEVNRNVGFKKNSNNCKQPQPRIGLFCRKKSSEVCLKILIYILFSSNLLTIF